MPNVTITQLPAAGPITGTELVAIVQNGQTLRTTTGAISSSPNQQQTFITVNQEPSLPNSRALSGATGIGITDGGALSTLQLSLNGASGSLELASNGMIVKTGSATVASRQIVASGAGISVSNGDGVAGNPTVQLTGLAASIANIGGTGMLSVVGGSTIAGVQILGTANQINVANGNGSGNPTLSLSANPTIPGTAAMIVPSGTTAQQPAGADGQLRFNTDTQTFDGYASGSWKQFALTGAVTSFSAGSTGLTPAVASVGNITLGGILNAASGGTGVNNAYTITLGGAISTADAFSTVGAFAIALTATGATTVTLPTTGTLATLAGSEILTNKTISGSSNTLSNIGNASLTNSSVTFNGTTVALGASGTITANTTNAVTFNNGGAGDASGTTFNGSAAKTVSYNTVGASPLAGSASLTTTGTITSGTWNATPIANAYLANSSITIGTTSISLGASSLTLGGLTSVAVTQDPVSALQLATKQYVDAVAEGLHVHASCAAATTGTLASITGGSVTYNNGTAGIGATLTLGVALTTLDGYSLQNGDRVLVKNEATQANNGIYTWATGGTVLTRATDFDTATEIASGDFTFVSNGTLYANTGWVQTNPVTTVGTDPVVFVQFSGAGTYSAGTGLTLTGSQFSLTSPVAVSLGGTGFTSYTAGDTLYASGSTTLSKLAIGASTYLLTSSGTAPQWTDPSSVTVGTATNIAGGTAGSLLYQSGASTTTTLAIGAANYVLTSDGSAPVWTLNTGTGSVVRATSPTITAPRIAIICGGTTTTAALQLRPTTAAGTTGSDIIFQVGTNGGTEVMRILNSAQVAIGLSAPSTTAKVHIAQGAGASSSPILRLSDTSDTYSYRFLNRCTAGSFNPLVQLNDHAIIYGGTSFDTGALVIGQWSTSARGIRIDSSGNVGIGTASPGATLDVAGTAQISSSLTLTGGTANGVAYLNGSKVVTTGSVLTFDGAILGVNGVSVGRGSGAVASNTAVGANALASNTIGTFNTAVGASALSASTNQNNNTAIGYQAAISTIGAVNVAIGSQAMFSNLGGGNNTAVGGLALYSNTSGTNQVAIGRQALYSNTTNASSTAVGYHSQYFQTGGGNDALGLNALRGASGLSTGTQSVAIGRESLYSSTSGSSNTALGYQAGYAVTTGGVNTLLGYTAGNAITTGNYNVVIGAYTGNSGGLDIRTASNNIVLSDGQANIRQYYLGASNAWVWLTGASERARIDSSGNVGIGTSSPAYKLDVSGTANFSGGVAGGTF